MTIADQKAHPSGSIRALDPFRDLEAVVDLIGAAFGDRLDPAGRATLERMRRFARGGPITQWVWAFLGRATAAPGLVWVTDEEIVGNVSIRRARSGGGYMVGNVVVHPERRGRGIARALMNRAIKVISRRGAKWVGLEVRVGNDVARGLYERLGFREVGRTHHLLRVGGAREAGRFQPTLPMRRGRRSDADALIGLVQDSVPEEHRPLLEIQPDDYRPGWARRVDHWLKGEDEIWWVVPEDSGTRGGVRTVRRHGAFPDQMEVLIRPEDGGILAVELIRRGVASLGSSPNRLIETSVPGTADSLVPVLKDEGFQEQRVLVQMKLSLNDGITLW